MKKFTEEEIAKIQQRFNDAEKTSKVTIFEEGELEAIGVTDWLEPETEYPDEDIEKECIEALKEYVKNYKE